MCTVASAYFEGSVFFFFFFFKLQSLLKFSTFIREFFASQAKVKMTPDCEPDEEVFDEGVGCPPTNWTAIFAAAAVVLLFFFVAVWVMMRRRQKSKFEPESIARPSRKLASDVNLRPTRRKSAAPMVRQIQRKGKDIAQVYVDGPQDN